MKNKNYTLVIKDAPEVIANVMWYWQQYTLMKKDRVLSKNLHYIHEYHKHPGNVLISQNKIKDLEKRLEELLK